MKRKVNQRDRLEHLKECSSIPVMLALYPRQCGNQHGIDWDDELLHRPHKKDGASRIQADRRGAEEPPNQKAVRTPRELIHQACRGKYSRRNSIGARFECSGRVIEAATARSTTPAQV